MKDVILIQPLTDSAPIWPYDLLAEVRGNYNLLQEQRDCRLALFWNKKWAFVAGKVPKTHNVIIPKGPSATLAEQLEVDVFIELNESVFDIENMEGFFDDADDAAKRKAKVALILLQAVMEIRRKEDSNHVPIPGEWTKVKPQNGRWFEAVRALNGGKPLFEVEEQDVRRRK